MRRAAMQHDRVETGEFHLGGEETAALRVADRAGLGRLGDRGHAALAGDRRAGEHAQRQRQRVLRA